MMNFCARLVRLVLALFFCMSTLHGSDIEIFPSHPRLFFRASPWGEQGLTLQTVKERASRPEERQVLERLNRSLPDLELYSLVTGDRAAACEAIRRLQEPIEMDGTTTQGEPVGLAALALDWLWDDPDFTPEARARAVENLADGAETLIHDLGSGAHVF